MKLGTTKPGDIVSKESIFLWIDLLGFSEALEDKKYEEVQEKLLEFRDSFRNGAYISEVISDGIILQIKEQNQDDLSKIFSEIGKKQLGFICNHQYFIRGSIAIGTKMNENDKTTGFIGTGLSRAYKMEEKHISWPIIGTTINGLQNLREYCKIPESEETFNLSQGFNDKGEEIYFINFLQEPFPVYYKILSDKVKEFKKKPHIQNKYIWMLRYYHHKFNSNDLDPSLLEVIL